jgi:hypothetical protein
MDAVFYRIYGWEIAFRAERVRGSFGVLRGRAWGNVGERRRKSSRSCCPAGKRGSGPFRMKEDKALPTSSSSSTSPR